MTTLTNHADPFYATAADSLRTSVRAALIDAGMSQAEAARQLGLTNKHVNMMLTGRATLTLAWAEKILALVGMRLNLTIEPIHAAETDRTATSSGQVLADKAELESLRETARHMNALYAAGLDNWPGCDIAREILDEEDAASVGE